MKFKNSAEIFVFCFLFVAMFTNLTFAKESQITPEIVRQALEQVYSSSLWEPNAVRVTAMNTLQSAIDLSSSAEYSAFVERGLNISPEELEKIYRKNPAFLYYDLAFERILRGLPAVKPASGEVILWYLYNMGLIVKTEHHCFGIDVHHRQGELLAPHLDFLAVTHNHSDHFTPRLLRAMDLAGKPVYSNFHPSAGYSKEMERMIEFGDLTIWTYESDHNKILKKFVMPVEIRCGKEENAPVIFSSGDSCNAMQLKHHSPQIDLHIVHPYVNLDVVEAATKSVQGRFTMIAHLQEMDHDVGQWRWTAEDGRNAASKVQNAGKNAIIPAWGERIILRR